MENDRQITISVGKSRKDLQWSETPLWWSEMITKLQTPERTKESFAVYMGYTKKQQDELKDVGGFVGGTLKGGRRKAANVLSRDIITLDLDNIPPGGTQDVLRAIHGLGIAYCVYSTRKHHEGAPRLRLLVLLSQAITAEQYEPVARKLGEWVGMSLCDPTTFEASRLMYWPSCSADSVYIHQWGDGPFLDGEGTLALYKDWRDHTAWAQVPGVDAPHVKHGAKQEDPTTKAGIVGVFCRIHDIHSAIETYLPGAYTPCDDSPGRYSYAGGSTTGGAVIYDNGLFLYSHHATDPAGGGALCNAFDLVRLHRFHELDDEAKPGTLPHQLPSFKAMCDFAMQDEAVASLLNQERYEKATQEFGEPVEGATAPAPSTDWMKLLKINPTTGKYDKTTRNVQIILENDPNLKGKIRMNRFAEAIIGYGPLPWTRRASKDTFEWVDEDDAELRMYVERILEFRSVELVLDATVHVAAKYAFDPMVEYLEGLDWDDEPRLDTLFIDYLGAEDCPYTRAVTRKSITALAGRIMKPGIKYDNMVVIDGKQGIGKSTLLAKLGGAYFTDNIHTMEGKDAAELLRGIWLVEIGELGAYSKSDAKMVKMFLSRTEDHYRAAYARKTEKHLRRCAFFGTTNDQEYLKDPSGNRRFWPIPAMKQKPTKDIFKDFDKERDQILAEAYLRFVFGEPLYLDAEMEAEAERRRQAHVERDPLQGRIEEFLEKKIPRDWHKYTKDQRLAFWEGLAKNIDESQLVPRDRVCVAEIWHECFREYKAPSKMDSHRINAVLEALPGWVRSEGVLRFGDWHGRQRGYRPVHLESVEMPGNVINITKNHEQKGEQQGQKAVNKVP